MVPADFEPIIAAEELLRLNLFPLRFIPRKAKTLVASAAATAFSAPPRVKWWMIFAFSKLVLSKRGEHVRVVESLMARAKSFSAMDFATLLTEARAESKRNSDQMKAEWEMQFEKGKDAPNSTPYSELEECSAPDGSVFAWLARARSPARWPPCPLPPSPPALMKSSPNSARSTQPPTAPASRKTSAVG